jgi:hypothetical protein
MAIKQAQNSRAWNKFLRVDTLTIRVDENYIYKIKNLATNSDTNSSELKIQELIGSYAFWTT